MAKLTSHALLKSEDQNSPFLRYPYLAPVCNITLKKTRS